MANITLDMIRQLEKSGDDAESHPANPDLPHAFGRHQITVPTAQTYGFKDATPDKLKDPEYNTQVAGAIVSKLNDRYTDNDAALIAYNGGDGMAQRWLSHGKNDAVLAKETQAYVARGRGMYPKPEPTLLAQDNPPPQKFDPAESTAKLRAAGFSWDQINDFYSDKRTKLQKAGFSDDQINDYLGIKVAGMAYPDFPGAFTSVAGYFGKHVADAYKSAWDGLISDWQTHQKEIGAEEQAPTVTAAMQHFFNGQIALGKLPVDAFKLATAFVGGLLDASAITPIAMGEHYLLPQVPFEKLHEDVANAFLAVGPEGGLPGATARVAAMRAATPSELVDAGTRVAAGKTGTPAGMDKINTNLTALSARSGESVTSIGARAETDPVLREQIIGDHPPEGTIKGKGPDGEEFVMSKLDEPKQPSAEELAAEQTPEQKELAARKWEKDEPVGTVEEARAAIRSRLVEAQRPKMTFSDYMRQAYDQLFDDQAPWKRLLAAARGDRKIDTWNNAEALQSLATGARGVGHYQLEHAQTDINGVVLGKSMKQILAPLKPGDDFNAFEEYAVARRAVELHDRSIETGLNDNAVRKLANDPEMRAKYEPILQDLMTFQNNSLKVLQQGGLMSDEAIEGVLADNQVRVPFRREAGGAGPSSSGGTVYSPIKAIKGSDQRILGPVEQIMRQTFVRYELALKNRANVALIDDLTPAQFATKDNKARSITLHDSEIHDIVDAAGGDPDMLGDDFGSTIYRHFKFPIAEDQVPIWRGGKSEVYTLADPEAAKALRGMGGPMPSLFTKLLSKVAGVQRAGIVLKPGFALRQVAYDLPFQFVVTPGYRNTVADFLEGMVSKFVRPELHDEFMRSGAWRPAFDQVGDRYVKTQIDKYYDKTDFFGGVRNALTTPFRGLKAFADYVYQSQRRGRYVRERLADTDQTAAAVSAQKATFHTGEKGSWAAQVNQIQPFFSAYLNGWKRFGEAVAARPAETFAKTLAVVTAPVIANYWAYKDEDWYKEAPAYKKDMGILLPPSHADGDPYFIPVVPGLATIFAAIPRRIIEALHESKAIDPAAFAIDAAHELLPWQATYNAAMPLVENIANYSFFKGRPFVDPDMRKNVAAPEQYTPYTSESAKQLSRFVNDTPLLKGFNLAPWQIDNYVEGWTGGLGQAAVKYADQALRATGKVTGVGADGQLKVNEAPEETMADSPWFGSFTVRYPTAQAQSINDFSDRFQKLEQAHGSIDKAMNDNDFERFQELVKRNPIGSMLGMRTHTAKLPDQEPYLRVMQENRQAGLTPALAQLNNVNKAMKQARQFERAIRINPDYSAHDKRQLLDQTYGQMVEIARRGNHILDALGAE